MLNTCSEQHLQHAWHHIIHSTEQQPQQNIFPLCKWHTRQSTNRLIRTVVQWLLQCYHAALCACAKSRQPGTLP